MVETSARPVKRPANSERTRARILDAAEALFADRGYYGVSLRDITQAAGVQLALANYHFGSKEELFRHVIGRRGHEHVETLSAALDQVIADAGEQPPVLETIIRAFFAPVVDRVVRGDEGWQNYIRLLAQVSNVRQQENFLSPVTEFYDDTARRFIAQIARALPGMDATTRHWAFYFYQAAIVHILTQSGLVDRQSDGLCRSDDLDGILEKLVPFIAAGFERLAKPA